MRQLSFGLLLFAFVFLNAQCGRDDCEVVPGGKKYYAWVPVTYSPMQERFKIGDTITVEIQVPTKLEDSLSGKSLIMNDIKFDDFWGEDIAGSVARFYKEHDGSTKWLSAASEFTYNTQEGIIKLAGPGNASLAIKFQTRIDGARCVKFNVIPNNTGLYKMGFFTNFIDITGITDNYCAASLQLIFGEKIAHNFHLLDDYDSSKVGNYEQNRGSFTFIVEE